jgi:hypothetical protein
MGAMTEEGASNDRNPGVDAEADAIVYMLRTGCQRQ